MKDYRRYRTHDHSRRLHGWDYTRAAAYFVTVCTHGRACLFGEVVEGRMRLSAIGHIVEAEWRRSEALRDEVVLDTFVVMPNHLHGIVLLVVPGIDPATARNPQGYHLSCADANAATQRAASLPASQRVDAGGRVVRPGSLGAIVRAFKSAATRRINQLRGMPGTTVWQPNYYDRILRDERAWRACRRYIEQNPARWADDTYHPDSEAA